MRKNIVLLSDGTGNSAAKLFKTNIWRLYQAIDRSDPPQKNRRKQIAFYDDGVGTSSFRPLAIIGGAFGIGLKRNVKELYTFVCQNWETDDDIYVFGFSRGAFTIRVLIGLIASQGIIRGRNLDPVELKKQVDAAYKRDREDYGTSWRLLMRRDFWTRDNWRRMIQGDYTWLETKTAPQPAARADKTRPPVKFVGLFDTVDAYGLPIDELKRGLDRWLLGLSFPDQDLSPIVERACHAISLDDERRTFHPVLWNERYDKDRIEEGSVKPDRLQQVWFAGMHSNVGGGYAKDGIAYVALRWMMAEAKKAGLEFPESDAEKAGLEFYESDEKEIARLAEIHDEMGNSRAGLAAYYRYDPRRLQSLCDDGYNRVWIDRPKIHHSVLDRIRDQYVPYTPHTVPGKYDLVGPDGTVIANPYETEAQALDREKDLERAWDLVWWRRIVYFITIGLTAWLVLFLWLCAAETAKLQPLPGWAETWIGPFRRGIDQIAVLAVGLAASMFVGKLLERGIALRASHAWSHLTEANANSHAGSGKLSEFARSLRTSYPLVRAYRVFARTILPFLFFLAVFVLFALGLKRLVFDIRSASGQVCEPTAADKLKPIQRDSAASFEFDTNKVCYATGFKVQRDQAYAVDFDAVWAFAPRRFYRNNHGTAQVAVRVASPTP